MAGGKNSDFLKKIALKRGCTVAAMLAVAAATQDGNVAQDKAPKPKDNPVEKTVSVENASVPIIRTPDTPIPQDTLDLGGPAGLNLDGIFGLNIPQTIYPDKLPLQNNLQQEMQAVPDLEPETILTPEDIKEFFEDGKDLHYEICDESKENIKEELEKINSEKFNEAEQDSMLINAYTEAQVIKTSKFFNLDFVSDFGNGMLTLQKSVDILLEVIENPNQSQELKGEIKKINKESQKFGQTMIKEINDFKKDFDIETMHKALLGNLDRKTMHKSINSALAHAESYCRKIDRKEQKKEQQEDKAIKKDVDKLYKKMMQQYQR